MASITIRNLDDSVSLKLRVRAAQNNRSMEAEARIILCEAVSDKETSRNFAVAIRSHFGSTNGVDLNMPVRDSGREPPTFD